MSGVPNHCHHLSLVWGHTCIVQFTQNELYAWSLYICAWPCHNFVDCLSWKCINLYLIAILINHDCLPILVLLYIMLHIMLAYLMLFAVLSNAVCLHNAFVSLFLLLIFANHFVFMFSLGVLTHRLFISSVIFDHVQCFWSVGFFLFYFHTIIYMKELCALW